MRAVADAAQQPGRGSRRRPLPDGIGRRRRRREPAGQATAGQWFKLLSHPILDLLSASKNRFSLPGIVLRRTKSIDYSSSSSTSSSSSSAASVASGGSRKNLHHEMDVLGEEMKTAFREGEELEEAEMEKAAEVTYWLKAFLIFLSGIFFSFRRNRLMLVLQLGSFTGAGRGPG